MLDGMAAQLVGWAGSVLLIVSLKQKDPTRFRIMNLVASALMGVFAVGVGAWPSFSVNAMSVVVNAHELWTMRAEAARDDATDPAVPARPAGPALELAA